MVWKYAVNLQENINAEVWLCNFIEIALLHWCSPVNLQDIFRTPFPRNTPGRLLLNHLFDQLQSFKCYLCHQTIFYWLMGKCFVHQSKQWSLLFLLQEVNIAFNLFEKYYFQMIKQKAYLLLENLDELTNLNIGFVTALLPLNDICIN